MALIYIDQAVKDTLEQLKLCKGDSYSEVIRRLLIKDGITIAVSKQSLTGETKVIAEACTSTESTIKNPTTDNFTL
jgi:predicted CopG family antitoxin